MLKRKKYDTEVLYKKLPTYHEDVHKEIDKFKTVTAILNEMPALGEPLLVKYLLM